MIRQGKQDDGKEMMRKYEIREKSERNGAII